MVKAEPKAGIKPRIQLRLQNMQPNPTQNTAQNPDVGLINYNQMGASKGTFTWVYTMVRVRLMTWFRVDGRDLKPRHIYPPPVIMTWFRVAGRDLPRQEPPRFELCPWHLLWMHDSWRPDQYR